MRKKSKYEKESLTLIIKESSSFSEVLRKLGLKCNGGNHRTLTTKITLHSLNTDHFTGQRWAKAQTSETSESIRKIAAKIRRTNEEVFVENSPVTEGSRLKKRLIDLGREDKCSTCGLTTWLDKPITLHVDHINGINNDNRVENLQFLCPNCHQQTDTWGNKNSRVVEC